MKAIVDIKGKQYEIEEGRYVQIDHYGAEENESVVLGNVCMIIAGDQSILGSPFIEGATVKTTVKRHARGPKVLVYKMRCKKGYRRKNGHRQGFTELQIEQIDFAGRDKIKLPEAPVTEAKPASKSKKASAESAEAKPKADAPAKKAPAKKEATAEVAPAEKPKAPRKKAEKPVEASQPQAVDAVAEAAPEQAQSEE